MREDAKTRALDKISRLGTEPGSLVTFWDQATEVLQSAVPHYTFPCWYTIDPASLLITSHYNPFMPELPPDSLALEYYSDDVNQIVDVARTESGISTLHEATNGDPSGSPRWQVISNPPTQPESSPCSWRPTGSPSGSGISPDWFYRVARRPRSPRISSCPRTRCSNT